MGRRLPSLECVRGAAMLGVIGIHTGSQHLASPAPSIHLVAMLEIVTRFAVPIFFFVSAFGLFRAHAPGAPWDWPPFFRRRARAVLLPYLAWSLLYIAHYTIFYADPMLLRPGVIAYYLFFGFACYHLYFMVILLWFYALMPLWAWAVPRLRPWHFAPLLLAQVAFNRWSTSALYGYRAGNAVAQALIDNRLNYWVMHYLLVWLLGAYLGSRSDWWHAAMRRHLRALAAFGLLSMAALLAYYYWLVLGCACKPEWAVNAAQQLCPAGVVYTLGASLALMALFDRWPLAPALALGRHSQFMYLAHPLAITYLNLLAARLGLTMTVPVTLAYYAAVVALTLGASMLRRRLARPADSSS